MKILLSAYACEPDKGSEPGVGWNWANEIAKLKHSVVVLTRKNNRKSIESFYLHNKKPNNLNFIYYDVPKWIAWWKKGGRGVRLYYFLWQVGAFFVARSEHRHLKFEQVQHITFVSLRQPSFMGLLGIPFIFGPLAGGDKAPMSLRKGFSLFGKLRDRLRDLANFLVRYDPWMHLSFSTADKILVTSLESKKLVPSVYRSKVSLQLAIGVKVDGKSTIDNKATRKPGESLRLLYVGRFDYLKGLSLALKALHIASQQVDMALTFVGSGPEKGRLESMVIDLSLSDRVTWVDWVPQTQLAEIYRAHDVFVFPSLRDSGGMVVLEAMAEGLPVICLNLGGPGVITTKDCGFCIEAIDRSEVDVVEALSEALKLFAGDPGTLKCLSAGAVARSNEMTWARAVGNVYLAANKE